MSKRGVLVLLVAGCVVSFLYVFDLTRFSDKEAVSGSDGERKLFAQIGLNMVNDNPYFGVGWGRYISEFSNYSSTVDKLHIGNHILDASKQDRRVSHNDFLRIMAELGWLSLLLCIIYCGYCIHILMFQTMALSGVVFPIWCGMILFSLTHNNLNTAFSWYFLLLPIFIKNLNLRSKYHGY